MSVETGQQYPWPEPDFGRAVREQQDAWAKDPRWGGLPPSAPDIETLRESALSRARLEGPAHAILVRLSHLNPLIKDNGSWDFLIETDQPVSDEDRVFVENMSPIGARISYAVRT